MTSGDPSGTSGRSIFWRGFGIVAAFLLALNTVNALSILSDRPDLHPTTPFITEGTSGLAALAFAWIGWLAFKAAPPGSRPLWRMLAIHVVAALAFSAAHVTAFVLLRRLIFGLVGRSYAFGPIAEGFVYELRKDVLAYVLVQAAYWAMARLARAPAAATPTPALFDIRDGARVIRIPVADILAARSAGNYVEFLLADGRKPLMRSPLSALEAELAPLGFVRTHRSWLVNAARVTELRPEKSGDYAVRLGELEAPLSRRFPQALARLRAG